MPIATIGLSDLDDRKFPMRNGASAVVSIANAPLLTAVLCTAQTTAGAQAVCVFVFLPKSSLLTVPGAPKMMKIRRGWRVACRGHIP